MAFSASNPPFLMLDGPGGSTAFPRVFFYGSTHVVADVTGTGFFAACGDGSRSGPQVGMRVGDLLLNRSSSDAAVPGRTTIHSVIGSTFNGAGSTALSTNYSGAYDVTVSST